jgi:hypothetical protein
MEEILYWNIFIIISFIVIILTGLIGNVINIIVFSHKSIKNQSTFRYLFYLSIVDLLVLIICSMDSLLTYGFFIMIRLNSDMIYKIHTFSTYLLTHLSSCILMLVSIERAFVITKKNSFGSIFKRKNTRLKLLNKKKLPRTKIGHLISLISLILIILNSHYLIFLKLNVIDVSGVLEQSLDSCYPDFITNIIDNNQTKEFPLNQNANKISSVIMCYPKIDSNYFNFLNHLWVWIDLLIFSLLPFLIMVMFSIIVLIEIKAKGKHILDHNKGTVIEKPKQRNRQILIMLSLTNLYFIFCTFPLCLYIALQKLNKNEPNIFQIIFQVISYSNNSINFLFYYLFSHKYRHVLKLIFMNKNKSNDFLNSSMATNQVTRLKK